MRPTVVPEVPSPSTEHHDGGRKSTGDRTIPSPETGVPVRQDAPRVEARHRGAAGWRARAAEGIGAVADVPPLDARLPLAQVYETLFPTV